MLENSDNASIKYFGARLETIDRLSEMYKSNYFDDEKLKQQREVMYAQELDRLAGHVDLQSGGRILDVGCGPGKFLEKFGSQWEKYGIEVSPWARKQAEDKGVTTNFDLQDSFFDLIIFRGTWQHLPDPITKVGECYYWLKAGGKIVFLATPNVNSFYYRVFPRPYTPVNFLVPTDAMLRQVLINFGFKIRAFEYPYLGTPYAKPLKNLFQFGLKLVGLRKAEVPFFGKVMECYAEK